MDKEDKMSIRQKNIELADRKSFDVAIIGGGINGASIYRRLCRQGYKVFLIDKGDFSCGTSQASAMMVWGGLLYLKNLDLRSIYWFSKDRDTQIESFREQIHPQDFRYIPNRQWGRNAYAVYLAMQFYWILGKCRRKRPVFETDFEESAFILGKPSKKTILYQEGAIQASDSRYVLDWIIGHQTEDTIALNYCTLQDAAYHRKEKTWFLNIADNLSWKKLTLKTKMILNCAGTWTDTVNRQFGIRSPYKHIFSKGVFIGFRRPKNHNLPLIFEMGEHGDVLTFIPWGPVSLWGPTETMENSIEQGYSPAAADVRFLVKHAARHLRSSFAKSQIVSLRCGLRPLAVDASFASSVYPLNLSRIHKIHEDPKVPWISIYGGKISGCISMADEVLKKVAKQIMPHLDHRFRPNDGDKKIPYTFFPGVNAKVPDIRWCVNNEFCCTLEDYLRRRTNIAQWLYRAGFGYEDKNVEHLRKLSKHLPKWGDKDPECFVREYRHSVNRNFDQVIEQI